MCDFGAKGAEGLVLCAVGWFGELKREEPSHVKNLGNMFISYLNVLMEANKMKKCPKNVEKVHNFLDLPPRRIKTI